MWDTVQHRSSEAFRVQKVLIDVDINNTQSAPRHSHLPALQQTENNNSGNNLVFQTICVFCSVCPGYVWHTAFAGQLNYGLILMLLISHRLCNNDCNNVTCGGQVGDVRVMVWSIFGNWAHIIQSETYRMNVRHMMNLSPWINAPRSHRSISFYLALHLFSAASQCLGQMEAFL